MAPVLAPTFMAFPTHYKTGRDQGSFDFPFPQSDENGKSSNDNNNNNEGNSKNSKNFSSSEKGDSNNNDNKNQSNNGNKDGNSSDSNKSHQGDGNSSGSDNGGSGSHGSGNSGSDSGGNTGSNSGSNGDGNTGSNSGSNGDGNTGSSSGSTKVSHTTSEQDPGAFPPSEDPSDSSNSSTASFPTATPQGSDEGPPFTSLTTSSVTGQIPTPFPLPSSTISSQASIAPSSLSASHSKILPLGSIIAIILGILFCITLGCVIYVFTSPKFGRIKRFWKRSISRSWIAPSYHYPIPAAESSFGNKELGVSYMGNDYYRPIYETAGPSSRSVANFRAFRFGGRTSFFQENLAPMPEPPEPVLKSSSSRSRSREMSMAPSSSSRGRSIFSLSKSSERPSTRYTARTSLSRILSSEEQQTEPAMAERPRNAPEWSRRSRRSWMSSIARSEHTIYIPGSSGRGSSVTGSEYETYDEKSGH